MQEGRAEGIGRELAGEDFPRRRYVGGLLERRCDALKRPGSSANERGGDGKSYQSTRGRRGWLDGGRRRCTEAARNGRRGEDGARLGAARKGDKRAPVDAAKLLVASKCTGVASISGLTADRERDGGLDERRSVKVGEERMRAWV